MFHNPYFGKNTHFSTLTRKMDTHFFQRSPVTTTQPIGRLLSWSHRCVCLGIRFHLPGVRSPSEYYPWTYAWVNKCGKCGKTHFPVLYEGNAIENFRRHFTMARSSFESKSELETSKRSLLRLTELNRIEPEYCPRKFWGWLCPTMWPSHFSHFCTDSVSWLLDPLNFIRSQIRRYCHVGNGLSFQELVPDSW